MDILQTLSLARTALDDPGALDDEWREPSTPYSIAPRDYAVERIDEVMQALDFELRLPDALFTLAVLVNEAGEALEAREDSRGGTMTDLGDELYRASRIIDQVRVSIAIRELP